MRALSTVLATSAALLALAVAMPIQAQDRVPTQQAETPDTLQAKGVSTDRTVIVLRAAIAPELARVSEVLELGRMVRLDDGSVWEVLLEHRARSDGWEPGDVVRVRSLPAPVSRSYDLRLENLTKEWSVAARATRE